MPGTWRDGVALLKSPGGGEAQHSLATTVTPTSPSMGVWLTFGRARTVLWQLEPSGGGQDQRHPNRDASPLRARRLRLQRVSPDALSGRLSEAHRRGPSAYFNACS